MVFNFVKVPHVLEGLLGHGEERLTPIVFVVGIGIARRLEVRHLAVVQCKTRQLKIKQINVQLLPDGVKKNVRVKLCYSGQWLWA